MAANDNLGKMGEMNALILTAQMGKLHPRVEPLRHTATNMPDNGVDVELKHTEQHWQDIQAIVQGRQTQFSGSLNDTSPNMTTRIDVKNHQGKLSKPQVEKFIGDCAKNPTMNGDILLGGNGLTKGAEQALRDGQAAYPQRKIAYIDNDGWARLNQAVLLPTLPEK